MDYRQEFERMLAEPAPILALAPMQDITDLPFWRVLARYGGADVYYTEYFRVYPGSVPDKHIARSILENPTGQPVVAQMIGNDVAALVRTAQELQRLPVAGIDLNLGCPAPIVYRKCAGGGLLRDLAQVDRILGALRQSVRVRFSVKTRVGFDSADVFPELLQLLKKHSPDLVIVHARTVKDGYHGEIRHEHVRQAVNELGCPVLANGDVSSAHSAAGVLAETGAAGVMLGRGAVRNPWLFRQIRQYQRGEPVFTPRGRDVLEYINVLWEAVSNADAPERSRVQRIKKHMNFVGVGIDPEQKFLHGVQRAQTAAEFFNICKEFLDHERPMLLEPFKKSVKPRNRADDFAAVEPKRSAVVHRRHTGMSPDAFGSRIR